MIISVSAFLVLSFSSSVFATASGLNNIPTADIPPKRTVVLQEFTTWGREPSKPKHTVGFKTSFFDLIEFGMDRQVGTGHPGGVLFQAKVRYDFKRDGWPIPAAGVANVAFDADGRKRSGLPFPYLVLTEDLKLLRAHVGVDFQEDGEGVFFGFDGKPLPKALSGLTLRTDGIMINNAQDLLYSVGFIYEPGWKFPFNVAVESWYSFSSAGSNDDDSFLLKLDYIIHF